MKRLLIVCSQLLSVFLLSGYGQLIAHTYHDECNHYSVCTTDRPAFSSPASGQRSPMFVLHRASSATDKQYRSFEVTFVENEEEDHKTVASKKATTTPHLFAILCYAQAFHEFLLADAKKFLPEQHAQMLTTYERHILLQVLRL